MVARCTLTKDGNAVVDVTEITAETPHQFDWFFHSEGDAVLPRGGTASSLPGNEASYTYLYDVTEYGASDGFEATFSLDGQTLTVRLSKDTVSAGKVFTARMPGNPANTAMTAIIVRINSAHVRIEARYEVKSS